MTGPIKHIRTYTGREINLFRIQPEDINIIDIAHALSNINRFNGHTRYPINVAQHSIYVSRLVEDETYQLQGLLHDAAEAYVGDVTKWLKHEPWMKPFRDLEDHIQCMIFEKFGCPIGLHSSVEEADRIMVRIEGIKGFGDDFVIDHPNYPPLTKDEIRRVRIWTPWGASESKTEFNALFQELIGVYRP